MKTYRAFISYNRGADAAIAEALATALTRFARPWYRTRAMRVFLDRNSLATNATLWGAIERALASSEWLVLLACPASAASPWVSREVAWWLAHRPLSRLIIACTGGAIAWDRAGSGDFDWAASTALTPALRGVYRAEPLWADLQAAVAAPRKTVADPAFRDAFLTIASQIHGVPKDELWNAEQGEQRKRVWAASGAALAIALVAWGGYNQWKVSMDRKENLASIQLGAKAFLALPADAQLAAQIALAGVALRPSGIAASALRSAFARMAGPAPSLFESTVSGAFDLAFSADAAQIAVLARDGRVTVLDAVTGRMLRELAPPTSFDASAIAWARDGTLAIAGDRGLRLWQLDAGKAGAAAAPAVDRMLPAIRALAISSDGKRLALAHADGSVRIVSAASGETTQTLAGPAGGARAIAFSADGAQLAVGGERGELVVWDTAEARVLMRLVIPRPVVSVDFNPQGGGTFDGQMLAVADLDGELRLIDTGGAQAPGAAAPPASAAISAARGAGVAARFVASGRCVARAGAVGDVTVETTLGFQPLFQLGRAPSDQGAPAAIVAMSLAQTRHFATLDSTGRVAVYDQPLCGDAEAVCGFGERSMTARMTLQDRLRWIPADLSFGPDVRQPPGPVCRALIDRVLAPPSVDLSTIRR